MADTSNYRLSAGSFKAAQLSEKRIVFVNSSDTLIDDANLTFSENKLATDSVSLASANDGVLQIQDITGTNTTGKSLTISSGRGTGTAVGGNIVFKTASSAEAGTSNNILKSRMTILNSGNVGIGTITPASKLHIEGDCTISSGVKFLDVNSYSWTQTGSDISGEANGDFFGTCIDINIDGSLLIVGAYMNSGNGTNSGHARVFEYNVGNNSWVQKGSDIDGEAAGDQSGLNVSISDDGNYIASGAPYNSSGGTDSGHVKIYKWNGSGWGGTGFEWEIVGLAGSNFGYTNRLNQDGKRILLGGWRYQNDKGIVDVYELSSGTWSQMGSSLTGGATGDEFGKWADINGNGTIMAVGSPGADGSGTNRGNVKVYEWNSGSSVWAQKGSTIVGALDQDKLGDRFGISLSRSGLILALASNTSSSNDGYVKVYQWDSGGSDWVQLGSTLTGDEGSRYGSGISLNEDGTYLAIGAFSNDDNGTDPGQTQIFNWDGSAWNQLGGNIDGSTDYDISGSDVRINSDGSRVIIASPQISGNNLGTKTGIVKAYNLQKTSNTTTLKGSSSLTSDITFTFPSETGSSGNVLSTDGSGNLSWVSNSGGGGGAGNINDLSDGKSGGDNFSNSIILGHETTGTLSSASNNTALGFGTIQAITSGNNNTALGYNAGNALTTGTNNTFIGSGAASAITDGENQTAIGFGATCVDNNEVSLGNSSVTTLRCATAAIASLSDRRDKKDIIDCQYGLDFVEKLRPVQFTWDRRVLDNSDINNPINGKKRLGFIAQDFQDAMSNGENEILDLVNEVNPDRIEAKYANLIPILTKSIQELQRKIISLERQLMNK